MFDNIAQLENEVREFEKNILASKDLLTRLDALIGEVSKNQQVIAEQSGLLNQTIDEKNAAAVSELKSTTKAMADSNANLAEQVKSAVSLLQTELKSDNTGKLAELNQLLANTAQEIKSSTELLETNLEKQSSSTMKDAAECVESTLTTYSKQLAEAIDQMESLKKELVSEYQDFVSKLSSSNIDKVYERLDKLENDLHKKMMLLMAGIGIVAAIGLISIFL